MMKRTIVTTLALGLVTSTAWAAPTWSQMGHITGVSAQRGKLTIETDIPTWGICANAGKFYWKVSDPQSSQFLDIARTASDQNAPIQVLFDPSALNCWTGAPEITGIKWRYY